MTSLCPLLLWIGCTPAFQSAHTVLYSDLGILVQFLPDVIETDSQAFRTPWYTIAFTRRREVILGRIAMLGFLSENVGEVRHWCITRVRLCRHASTFATTCSESN